jgi:LPS export ABC transporter permease LptG
MLTLDRYVARQTVAPTLMALAVFTFLLAINPMLDKLRELFAKGVSLPVVGFLLIQLIPQALGQALPMAFLTGLLISLGRMSTDRESMALLASGVSPLRLLRPVLVVGLLFALTDFYLLAKVTPVANQRFRVVGFPLLISQGERDIRPGVFFEQFPGMVVFVRAQNPTGGWDGVLLADTSRSGPPALTLAEHGRLVPDFAQRTAQLVLTGATQYLPGGTSAGYTVNASDTTSVRIAPEVVLGPSDIPPGSREKQIPELQAEIARRRAKGESPHTEIIQLHQMFAFPAACLVFAVVGLGLGLNTRRDGKFASLALGIGVLMLYYAFLSLAEARVKGDAALGARGLPAEWARWVPNIALTLVGALALWWRMRGPRRTSLDLSGTVAAWFARRREAFTRVIVRRAERATPGVATSSASSRFPRLLDRYVGGRYGRTLMLTFVTLILLVYVFTFLDMSDKIFKGKAGIWTFVRFLWFSTPQYTVLVIPFATLLATLATMGGLTRTNELTIMRASGVSLYRTALPLLLGACLLSIALFALDERVLAASNLEAVRLDDLIRDRPSHTLDARNQNWQADQPRGRIYHYAAFDDRRRALLGLSIFEFTTSPYRLVSHTYANRVVHNGTGWQAEDGWTQTFQGTEEGVRTTLKKVPLDLPPIEDFRGARVDPTRLSFRELLAYNRKLGAAGFNVREHEVNLHRKIALPVAAVVLTLLAVPLGMLSGRHGALYGMGIAIALAVVYFLVQTLFTAAGAAAILPTPLAAWAANILFLSAALYLLLTVRT